MEKESDKICCSSMIKKEEENYDEGGDLGCVAESEEECADLNDYGHESEEDTETIDKKQVDDCLTTCNDELKDNKQKSNISDKKEIIKDF